MSSVTPLLSAREAYTAQEEAQGIGKDKVKKKINDKGKKPAVSASQVAEPSSTSEVQIIKNGAAGSKTEADASSKRKQGMEPPLVPQKKVKKLKQKKSPGTPFIVKDIEPDQSDRDKTSDSQRGGGSGDHEGSDECESVDEGFSLRLSDSYDSSGTLKLDSVSGESIRAAGVLDSREEGRKVFQWMIAPHSEASFFRDYWEKKPLYLKRNTPDYYKNLFSTSILDKILHEEKIHYTKNLDITSYSEGKRQTHNLVGQAHPSVVWDYYNNGCSLRLLNPQTFHRPVWKLLYNLQEHFNSFCGANVYLTPPGTQGFAPHWDDIEAFLLQLEGRKHWKVYKPRSEEEELPEFSSENLSQDEIGEPVLDITLEAGDLLYFPRGYIHQAVTDEDVHSIHITVSTYQRNSWGQYLQKLLPRAVDLAMAEDLEFRKGLPLDHLRVMGVVNSDMETPGRSAFLSKVKELMERLLLYAPFDAAADQFGANLMHDALPPLLGPEDKMCSVHSGGERWCKKKQKVINRVELDPDTYIRLIRGNVIRFSRTPEAMDDELLIELVRNHPVLYDLSQPKYMDSNFKQDIWNKIGEEMKVDGSACKSRWNNIRDNYRKSMKKTSTKSGQSAKKIKLYKFSEQLSFLKLYMHERETKGNIASEEHEGNNHDDVVENQEDEEENIQTDAGEPTVLDGGLHEDLQTQPLPSPKPTLEAKVKSLAGKSKKRVAPQQTASAKLMEYLISKQENQTASTPPHPVDAFLAGIAPTLKTLTPYYLNVAKSEIFATVQKYEMQMLINQQSFERLPEPSASTSSTSTPHPSPQPVQEHTTVTYGDQQQKLSTYTSVPNSANPLQNYFSTFQDS